MPTLLRPAHRGALTTRGLLHPYWTTKLHPAAPLAPGSANMAARLAAQATADSYVNGAPKAGKPPIDVVYGAPYNTVTDTGGYSIALYDMPAGTPRVRVWSRRNKFYTDPGTGQVVNLQTFLEAVPMPDPALMPDGTIAPSGTDGSIAIRQKYTAADGTQTARVWEMWQAAPAEAGTDPAGYPWKCEQAGYIADIRHHPGWWSGSFAGNNPVGGDFGVSASGFAYSGPILTGLDYHAADIRHPLTVALPITGGATSEPDRLNPATRHDRFNFTNSTDAEVDAYRVPEGARFRLPASWADTDIATYAAAKATTDRQLGSDAPTLAKVLRALRDYGLIVGDSAGVVGFSAEHGKTYGTPYNPLPVSKRPDWGNFGQQLPWDQLVQVAVPPVQFHTPGPGPTTAQPPAFDYSHAPA